MSDTRDILILQVSSDELQLVRARKAGDRVALSDSCSFWSRRKGEDSSPLQDTTAIDALVGQVRDRRWAGMPLLCTLDGSAVTTHCFQLPPLDGAALRQAATLKLGQQLHYPAAEAQVALRSHGIHEHKGEKVVQVQVTAARQSLVDAAIAVAHRAGLDLMRVCGRADALAALAAAMPDRDPVAAILHMDERASTLMVLRGSEPIVIADIPIAAGDLTTALMRPIINGDDVIQLDAPQAAAMRHEVGIPAADEMVESLGVTGDRLLPLLEPVLQKLAKQLTQWISFASTCAEACTIQRIVLVGAGAHIRRLDEALGARMTWGVVSTNWLDGLMSAATAEHCQSDSDFSAAVGAFLHGDSVPDLTPPSVRRRRAIGRVRRGVAWCGPVIAAGIVGLAMLFDHLGGGVLPAMASGEAQLVASNQTAERFDPLTAEAAVVRRLEGQFDRFGGDAPHWIAVFKELSCLLPRELQATEITANDTASGFGLTVRGRVVGLESGDGFDEVVTQTLLLLQRSALFRRVEVVSANRLEQTDPQGGAGTLAVELELAPCPVGVKERW